MTKTTIDPHTHEALAANHHEHLVCWKSCLAGFVVSFLVFALLTALGTGIAGLTAESLIAKETGGSALFTVGGLWLGLSVVIAVFCGSYFAARVARYLTYKVGGANGLLVAAIFFAVMLVGAGQMIGGLASGLGSVAKSAGEGAAGLSSSPVVQDAVNKAVGSANLKADPKVVAEGLAVRLAQGNTQSAKDYLGYQTGMSSAEVDGKIAELEAAAKTAAEKTARAIGDTGLILFVVLLFGISASILGGALGAYANTERPFYRVPAASARTAVLSNQHGSAIPYLIGWMMGVPVTILLLIAMFRSVF